MMEAPAEQFCHVFFLFSSQSRFLSSQAFLQYGTPKSQVLVLDLLAPLLLGLTGRLHPVPSCSSLPTSLMSSFVLVYDQNLVACLSSVLTLSPERCSLSQPTFHGTFCHGSE